MGKVAKVIGTIATILVIAMMALCAVNLYDGIVGGQAWYDSAWEFGFIMDAPPVAFNNISCILYIIAMPILLVYLWKAIDEFKKQES